MPGLTDAQISDQAAKLVAAMRTTLEEKGLLQPDSQGEVKEIPSEVQVVLEKISEDFQEQLRVDRERQIRNSGGFGTIPSDYPIPDLKEADTSKMSLNSIDNDVDLTSPFIPRNKVYSLTKRDLLKWHDPETVECIEYFKNFQDALFIAGMARAHRMQRHYFDVVRDTKAFSHMNEQMKSDVRLRKALDTLTANEGAEWIPTGFSSQLLELIYLELRVASNFQNFNMPTNPFRFPVDKADATAYLIAEATSDAASKIRASTPQTTNLEFSAQKLAARVLFSEELNEDSAVSMLDYVRGKLSKAIAVGVEQALLNGDDAATHQDNNVTDTQDARKAFQGHRYWALNNAGTATKDFSNAIPTATLLRNVRELMGKYSVDPNNLFMVVGPKIYHKILQIAEVLTIDKYGGQATLVTGEIGRIDGMPIMISEYCQEDLNASGVYDGVTTDRGVIHMIDRRGFMTGIRSGVTIQSLRDIETDQMVFVAKHRLDHEDIHDATLAANIQTALGYNVKTT